MLSPYGLRVWLMILIITIALAGIALWWGWWLAAITIAAAGFAILSFFRDPVRRIPANLTQGAMLSPADGTVSAVIDVDHHETTQGPARIIRIFLSVLNVHINRSPCDVEVVSLRHCPGKYLNAQTEESARMNECNIITVRIRWSNGATETMGIRQVAGMIARTIVCPLRPGDQLKRGQKFGMIMFGSTTELILPRPNDVQVHVTKGDKVKAGVTVIATLQPPM
jgi:phosphatidylserine decarboxylase